MSTSVGREIYEGTASFGRFYSLLGAIIISLISIPIFMLGIYIINHKKHLSTATGIIQTSKCDTVLSEDGKSQSLSCGYTIKYTVNDIEYISFAITNKIYKDGDSITVYYDPLQPANIEIDPIPPVVGWVVIAIMLLLIIAAWVNVYMTRKFKIYSTVTGAGGMYSLGKRFF